MAVSGNRVMFYHADAAPIGGRLHHPSEMVLPTEGSVSLGQAGGHGAARVEGYAPHPQITTQAAYSEVTGAVDPTSGNWTTVVTATVEHVNLFDKVTADKIVARIAIEHPRVGYYPCISFAGCAFEHLRIAGQVVTPKLDFKLVAAEPPVEATAGAPSQETEADARPVSFPGVPWTEVAGFVERAVVRNGRITGHGDAPHSVKDRYAWMDLKAERTKKGYIACSLVEEIQGAAPGSTFGHITHVPGFGTVYLGELIVDARSFHLTMLRVEMESGGSEPQPLQSTAGMGEQTNAGVMSAASVRGNGFPSP